MRMSSVILGICSILLCGCAAKPTPPQLQTATAATQIVVTPFRPTPLILEKDEGERRIVRPWPGHPDPGESFILKVDQKNGGSSHLVFITADIASGGAIHAHRHPGADEILFLQTGTARVHLGDTVREVKAGATVFIPAGIWVSVDNIGKDGVSMATIFSAPGFDEFMRAGSIPEGDKNVPLTEAENDQIEKMHSGDVIYK